MSKLTFYKACLILEKDKFLSIQALSCAIYEANIRNLQQQRDTCSYYRTRNIEKTSIGNWKLVLQGIHMLQFRYKSIKCNSMDKW
jgi:hypothetical protein